MRIVSLETTSDYLGFGLLVEKNKKITLRSWFEKKPLQQSDLLIPKLDKFLKRAGVKPSSVDVWVVDVGPGSFTGVRIGVAAARALAQGFQKPLVGISGLEATAYKKRKTPGLLTSVRPALAAEVYAAVYYEKKGSWTSVLSPRWLSSADFESQLGALSRQKKQPVVRLTDAPHPEDLLHLALEKLSGRPSLSRFHYNKVVPLYLQPSWAERAKANARS